MPIMAHLAVSMVVPSKHSARALRASFTYPVTFNGKTIVVLSDSGILLYPLLYRSARMPSERQCIWFSLYIDMTRPLQTNK